MKQKLLLITIAVSLFSLGFSIRLKAENQFTQKNNSIQQAPAIKKLKTTDNYNTETTLPSYQEEVPTPANQMTQGSSSFQLKLKKGCTTDADCEVDDGNACTKDVCVDQTCKIEDVICNDNNPCTTDRCEVSVGCMFTPEGQVLPITEACGNAMDDNCDGQVDENCHMATPPADTPPSTPIETVVEETPPTEPTEPVATSAPYVCNSQIFDCEKTCSIWSPYKNLNAATALYPQTYEKEWLVFAGENNGQAGLVFQTSLQMPHQCNFSFQSCTLPTTTWEHIVSAQLNDAEWNDLVGITQTKEYFVLYNFDLLMQQKTDPCALSPEPLVAGLTPERTIEEQSGTLSKIYTLKSNKLNNERVQNIIAAVEVSRNSVSPRLRSFEKRAPETDSPQRAFVQSPASSSTIGLDMFHCENNQCAHTFVPVKNLKNGERIISVQLYFPDQNMGSSSMASAIIATNEGVEWFDCAQNGTWDCALSQTLEENPFLIVDRTEVRRRAGLKQLEGDQGRKILITETGHIGDLNFVDQEEAEVENREEQGGAAVRRRNHHLEMSGQVERQGVAQEFNPREAVDGWFQPDAQNMYVAEEEVLRGNMFALNENGEIRVETLDSETLNANALLNNIYSDGVIQLKNPDLLLPFDRKNFGGRDIVAIWDAIDTPTGDKEGTLISLYYNKNETPEVALETPQKENGRFRFAVQASDVMEDPLHCHASLKDQAGNDFSSKITSVDCNILEIDITPLLEEKEEAAATVAKTSLNASVNSVSWPLEGTIWATDPGNAEGSTSFSIGKSGSATVGSPLETPVTGGGDEETEGRPGFKTRGGGLCGATLAPQGTNLSFVGVILFFPLILPLFWLAPLRMRGGRGSNPRPRA